MARRLFGPDGDFGPFHHNYILDANGEPQPCDDILVWGEWFERAGRSGERVIAHDRNEARAPGEPDILVSTVFLAINHNFFGEPPILWETMVFGGLLDQEQCRYSSRAAALAGHRKMCLAVQASLDGQTPELPSGDDD